MDAGLLGEDVRLEGEWVDELGDGGESIAQGREERAYVGGYVVWKWMDVHRELYLRAMDQWAGSVGLR